MALVVGLPFAYLGVRRVLPAGTLTARRGLPANVVFAAALSMAFFTADLFIPLALTSVRGISATLAGIVLTAGIIGWTAGAYAPARLLKWGMTKGGIARLGAILVIAGLTVIGAVILTTVPVPVGTGLAGALVATMGATAAGLSGVLVVAGAGVVLALLAPTRFAETHPPLTPPER